MADREMIMNGHTWRWHWLSDSVGSLLCLDPIKDEDGFDLTSWPSDSEVSERVGRDVAFYDGGDNPDYPEGIFWVTGEEISDGA